VKRLAEASDVMISNFGAGVMEKLGLGAEEMLRRNPRLTIATISAFGQTGPYREYMGYGPLVHAVGGLSAQTGYADGIPRDIGTAYGDPNGGVFAAIAIAAALWARDRHGQGGQVIDVSMWEAMLCTAFEGWMNHVLGNAPHAMMGNRDPLWAPHNLYRCADEDRWVAIACTDETQWRALCGALGDPAMAADPRWRDAAARKAHEDELDARIGAWCAGRERWEVTRALQAVGVPAFPSLSNEELLDDPHLNARGLFTEWPHAEVGVRKLVGAPWHLARRANGLAHAAPLLGEHTDSVLERVLGLSAAERARLREQGAIE
jgi:crotonobetainyl-CoA:carnitine CoA-transferase CaiB-like acyl-CoA transferase